MGSLLIMTIDELFMKFGKDKDLKQYQILVVSRDIITNIQKKLNNDQTYESKYDNIDFVPSLLPTVAAMEFAYGDNEETFFQAYESNLISDETMIDLVSIVDMVVSDNLDVIIVVSILDMKSKFPYFLRNFIVERFKLNCYIYEELLDDESLNPSDIGNVEEIKTILDYYKASFAESENAKVEFFNRFTDNMNQKFKSILLSKSVEELVKYANKHGLHVNKRKPKEEIVETLCKKMFP